MARNSRGRVRPKDQRPVGAKPVERVEVSGKHLNGRTIAFLMALAVALGAITFGVYSWINGEPGWIEVEALTPDISCASDFTFNYMIGGAGRPEDEKRQIQGLYTQACVNAYRQFSVAGEIVVNDQVIYNLWYINSHPNQDIQVDPLLYEAFSQAVESGGRTMYLGPVCSVYEDLFFCLEDYEAQALDPFTDPEVSGLAAKLAAFASSPEHISLELLGENTVRLNISEEYLDYAQGVERQRYLDFGWQRNAYIIDYLAETMISSGHINGVITSTDGFSRSLGGLDGRQVYNACGWTGSRPVVAAEAAFAEQMNLASLCPFPLSEGDEMRFYVYGDGVVRHPYIDPADGLCKASAASLAVYSSELGCAQLARLAGAAFIAGELDNAQISAIRAAGGEVVAVEDGKVLYTQEGLELENLYSQNGLSYRAEQMP